MEEINERYVVPYRWVDREGELGTFDEQPDYRKHGFSRPEHYRLHLALQGGLDRIEEEQGLRPARKIRECLLERARLMSLIADPYYELVNSDGPSSEAIQVQLDNLNEALADFDLGVKATYWQLAEQGM